VSTLSTAAVHASTRPVPLSRRTIAPGLFLEDFDPMRLPSMSDLRCASRAVIGVALAAGVSMACSSSAPSGGNTQADGGSTGPGQAGTVTTTSKSPCELLLRADAEAAVGQPLPQADMMPAPNDCNYYATGFSAAVEFSVNTWADLEFSANAGMVKPVAISGIGDEALNIQSVSFGSTLYVRKGSDGFLLVLSGPTIDQLPDRGLAQEKILAAKVLANF
jgi:hypothetical protein